MAKQTNSNLSPATGGVAMFDLMVFLRDQLGFTITISGDGIAAFDNSGTSVITSGAAGANGMNNPNAHFTAEDPAGEYSWCFQQNMSSRGWEIVFSALDGFTGGGAAIRPTATDEQSLWNASLFDVDGTYRWHLEGDDAASAGAVGVYAWSAIATENGTGDCEVVVAHLPMEPGTYPELVGTRAAPTTGEPDPSVTVVGGDLTLPAAMLQVGTGSSELQHASSYMHSWYCMNGTNGQAEASVSFQVASYDLSAAFADRGFPADASSSDGVGPDPRDDSDPAILAFVGRVARLVTQVGPKGLLAHWKLKGTDRNYPDTVDIGSSRYVYIQHFLIPFEDGGTPLV